jgi:hypothetical protein
MPGDADEEGGEDVREHEKAESRIYEGSGFRVQGSGTAYAYRSIPEVVPEP